MGREGNKREGRVLVGLDPKFSETELQQLDRSKNSDPTSPYRLPHEDSNMLDKETKEEEGSEIFTH